MYRLIALTFIITVFFTTLCFAGSPKVNLERSEKYHKLMITEMEALQASEDIQPAEMQEYLFHAFLAVYYAKVYANMTHKDAGSIIMTNNLVSLVDLDYLESWPLNPMTWEPMKVLTPEDEFSAGDLCLALCPPGYYTAREGGPQAMSFDLFVYGPNRAFGEYGEIAQLPGNKEWSTPPEGVLYGFSYYVDPDSKFEED